LSPTSYIAKAGKTKRNDLGGKSDGPMKSTVAANTKLFQARLSIYVTVPLHLVRNQV